MLVSLLAATALVTFGRSSRMSAKWPQGCAPPSPDMDVAESLPWLGFMLSGAAGLIWYSYWTVAKGIKAVYYVMQLPQ